MGEWNWMARVSLVSLLLWPILARADDGGDAARALGKAMVASAKWQVPAIDGTWAVWCEAGGPVIVLADKSITSLANADGKQLWRLTEGVDQPRVIGGNDKVLLVAKNISQGPDNQSPGVTALSLADGSEKYQLPRTVGSHKAQVRENLIISSTGQAVPVIGTMGPVRGAAPRLTAYDLTTGKLLWQKDANKNESFRGFISDTQYLAILNDAFTMVDAATGATQWEWPIQSGWKGAGQVFQEDGTGLFMEAQASGLQRLLTVDLKTGKAETKEAGGMEGNLLAAEGDVLLLQRLRKSETVREFDTSRRVELTEEDKKEKIMAFDLKAGKAQWVVAIPRNQPTRDDLTLAGDVVLCGNPGTWRYRTPSLSESWTLTALDRANGKALWTREQMAGAPVVYKEKVILSGANFLEAVDRREGKTLWWILTEGAPSEPVIVEGVMYFAVRGNGQTGPGRNDGIFAIGVEGR
jgi:outer membrane protein assembly factor BamB